MIWFDLGPGRARVPAYRSVPIDWRDWQQIAFGTVTLEQVFVVEPLPDERELGESGA